VEANAVGLTSIGGNIDITLRPDKERRAVYRHVAKKHRRRLLVSQRADSQRNTCISEHTKSSRQRRENAARDDVRLSLAHAAAGPRETALSGDETSLRHRSCDDDDVLCCADRRREAEQQHNAVLMTGGQAISSSFYLPNNTLSVFGVGSPRRARCGASGCAERAVRPDAGAN